MDFEGEMLSQEELPAKFLGKYNWGFAISEDAYPI